MLRPMNIDYSKLTGMIILLYSPIYVDILGKMKKQVEIAQYYGNFPITDWKISLPDPDMDKVVFL
jgi:hypothetical protein